ncbi:lipoyl(octanoyl) transferase LipB [Candidatus Synechococcus calcipolaris G9]|uniref:Octanoyltransferase n=1 Tax=Candidatus Synechococcus calcipolaris G9 TaxID=1497997 RepID=A0ABT6F237_9SYNE|nr:lipoyl(octanoyl) transferase LipB [Candidatus Synechococcus calcipolaris]MDG2991916.1 lipoyl(octanoyl) transferase LipB [Candidatus Synechococcus calcipolaris G9]
MPSPPRPCWLYCPGIVPYAQAWQWQRRLVGDRRNQPDLADALIVLQHPPVYTLGQGASEVFLQFDPQRDVELYRVERGGEVTYHNPGQWVAYPILNLRHHHPDLHWYLRRLEDVLIQTLGVYQIKGERIPGLTGVWVEGVKVAAIGIKVSRWLTWHGIALNVTNDLRGFRQIVPCGIGDRPVGNLLQFKSDIDGEDVRDRLIEAFAQVFGLSMVPRPISDLET